MITFKRVLALFGLFSIPAYCAQTELKDLSINGGVQDGKARLIIEALLQGATGDRDKVLFSTTLQHVWQIAREKHTHTVTATLDVLQGEPKEFPLTITGPGEIRKVTGENLQDWSVRQETSGARTLVLRPKKTDKPLTQLAVVIVAERDLRTMGNALRPLSFAAPQPALMNGYLKVEVAPELSAQPTNSSGVIPIEAELLPEGMRESKGSEVLAFRFHGTAYAVPLSIVLADPEARRVVLRDFQLRGQIEERTAAFTLSATAHVKNPRGGSVVLLSGGVALAEVARHADWRVRFENGQFILVFDKPGEFPLRLKFNAAVREGGGGGWKSVDFRVMPAAVQPVALEGLAEDTQFQFAGAARPERAGGEFRSFLPPDGNVKLSWKEARAEVEGKLFYAAEMLSQINISPGLMRQLALIEGKVMQGELSQVVLLVRGQGNVTAVNGANVLAWKVEAGTSPTERRLVVQFNQPQRDAFTLQVQMQSELGAFPQAADAMQVRPEGATRFAGHFRVVNEGAVRLEVVQATGLSQISPEQFPETETTKALMATQASQRFAFRFSSGDFALRVQADNILPELSVSQLLAYHLGETELAIDGEFELDIREAPVREVVLRVPKGFAIARLAAAGLSDYFLSEPPNHTDAELRLVYGQPISERQVIQLRLERNAALGQSTWTLPRVEVVKAKSTRGHIAVSADAGFRLTPERTVALTDIATAFFPRKLAGIQSAFRLAEPAWEAAMRVERLPQSIQADVFHLFSIGEGIAYGSSTINYVISGSPVSVFRVQLSDEYFNVEFTGKDVRNWQKTTNGYLVQLHTPVSGAYTLLATCERPFKAQGDTLTLTGARPLDAQSEQGHTLVVSAYQFQVRPVNVSPGLVALETPEVPAEYRLFFDAPILAAYQYTARPFNLQLALSPLAQGETLSLVVDRAALNTRISKDGEVVTDVRYFVKNRGNPHFRLVLAEGTTLWSVTVNGATAVPVKEGNANLIPLPQRADPNAAQVLDLKLASRSRTAKRVTAAAPVVTAPVLLAEWNVQPDTGQRLEYRKGSLAPAGGVVDASGFAGLARMLRGEALVQLLTMAVLVGFALWAWRWGTREGTQRYSVRHVGGSIVGLAAIVMASTIMLLLIERASRENQYVSGALSFLAPVQQSGSALTVEMANVRDELTFWAALGRAWPALVAVFVWAYAFIRPADGWRPARVALGWTLVGWAALRWPNGAALFFITVAAFLILQVLLPALRAIFQVPRRASTAEGAAAPATAAILLGGLLCLMAGDSSAAVQPLARSARLAESVVQEVRVQDKFAIATAKIRWHASKDEVLPILFEPAVLTRISYPTNALKLVQMVGGGKRTHQLVAQQPGTFEVELDYQLHVTTKDGDSGIILPTQHGLVNQLTLKVADMDVDVTSPQAVSVQRNDSTNATVATLVLAPANESWIAWKPRSRDVKREKAVFFAELFQLYAPSAGVIEGVHQVQVRPAQGELSELMFEVPTAATITDVIDAAPANATNKSSIVSLWRFDPDGRKLRVTLNPAQSRAFTLVVRSQLAAGPLPFEQRAGLLSVDGAAGQPGTVGVATGSEVQLDSVEAEAFSVLNLEDFPARVLEPLRAQIAGLTLRRAFRYTDPTGSVGLRASAVEADIRVQTQETLSLGEDRTLLAVNASMVVTRAGIFRVSFMLPAGLDVESISGAALSHWTELRTTEGRIITLHLKGKTQGQHQFNVSLAGPGTKAGSGVGVPRLLFREASKQSGQLVIVPEQGMRLQAGTREGVTQLDPQKAGIRQKGVLAFRLLQAQWALALDIEQVDAWVQVTSLQHVMVSEAQMKVAANFQYQIENTGLKTLRIRVPTNAENVRFRGEQVADFLPVPGQATNGLQAWEVKLHRRIIGKYSLQATWQSQIAEAATDAIVRGAQVVDANLQRGFVTVQSGGRLQVRADTVPVALQPAEWQSIPRPLLQDIRTASANFTFRLVEAAYELPLQLERHEAAKLLPARVNMVTLTSVVSDEGVMLTQAKLDLIPGDKRLLHLTLPKEARFWFAFVNQNGVWPWRDQDRLLIPLEQQSHAEKPTSVELFYSSRIGSPASRNLDLALVGPKFDLPLENITWHVYLNEKWRLVDWKGTLQLQEDSPVSGTSVDVKSYLANEVTRNREKTKVAEEMLQMGNTLLEHGNPQQARRAFQSAYGLSTHDDAFNEDARVQLHNLKLQQALVGLNVRQSAAAGEASPVPGNLRELRNRKDVAYTQQEAKQMIDANTADDNATLMRLAERIVQQQDAAVPTPTAIRAAIPEQGRLLTFRRTVQVDTWADLAIQLEAKASRAATWTFRVAVLAVLFGAVAVLGAVARGGRRRAVEQTA